MTARALQFSLRTSIGIGVALAVGGVVVLGGAGAANASDQAPINLGTAASYDVLGATTVTNTGPTTVTDGDVGLSPGTSITGFPPATISNGVQHRTDEQAEQAQSDLTKAYGEAAGRPSDTTLVELGGSTLDAGVYTGATMSLTGTVTLRGGPESVFIFQSGSSLITASSSVVAFDGNISECNIYWQVGSSATLGSGSTFVGTLMALTSITAESSTTVHGRLLARNGAVTLDDNVLTRPAGCGDRAATEESTQTPEQAAATKAADEAAAEAAAAAQAAADAAAAAAAQAAADQAAQTAAAAAAAEAAQAAAEAQAAAAAQAAAEAAAAVGGSTGGVSASAARTGSGSLADTGSDLAVPISAGLLLALTGGGLLMLAVGRRTRIPAHRSGR